MRLLKKYVDNQGLVDYASWHTNTKDTTRLSAYISYLEANISKQGRSDNDVMAFWCNMYNALTVQCILKHYPVRSIKDIQASHQGRALASIWQKPLVQTHARTLSLDDIEHNILRLRFDEPRIHFALVCAALGCPPLRQNAYVGAQLNQQLNDQARRFLLDPDKNNIQTDTLRLSMLFKWFKDDFQKPTLTSYLDNYVDVTINPEAVISYLTYDWQLNEP